jgi:urease accessory protein
MDDASLIAALQLADSFFPSGMVTFSHGLETFITLGLRSGADIHSLLVDYLRGKVATCDLVASAQAHRATEVGNIDRLYEVDHLLTVALCPQEARQSSSRSGRAILDTLRSAVHDSFFQQFSQAVREGRSAGNAAVCTGMLCALWRIPARVGGLLQLYAFSVSFLSAAVRLGCLGHRETQRLLTELRPLFSSLVDDVLTRDLEEIGGFAPLADIRAMQHAYLPVRLFAS